MKIGIDIGGSHIGLGILNTNKKLIYKSEKDYSSYEKDMSEIVTKTIVELINEALVKTEINVKDIELVGIAVPGTVSGSNIVKAGNLGIKNYDIGKELKKFFDFEIKLQNDAKCAAIAEKEFGELNKFEDSVFLTIGTGVGGAVFLNGKLLRPKRYSGFEIGHIVIEKNGIKCACGRKGCFECYGSMRRFREKIKKEFNLPYSDGIRIKEFILDNINDEKIENIITTYIDDLSTGIINLINIFEPEAVSIGGSFAYYQDILLDKLKKRIIEKEEVFNRDTLPKIIIANLKNDAGIIGAAMI